MVPSFRLSALAPLTFFFLCLWPHNSTGFQIETKNQIKLWTHVSTRLKTNRGSLGEHHWKSSNHSVKSDCFMLFICLKTLILLIYFRSRWTVCSQGPYRMKGRYIRFIMMWIWLNCYRMSLISHNNSLRIGKGSWRQRKIKVSNFSHILSYLKLLLVNFFNKI